MAMAPWRPVCRHLHAAESGESDGLAKRFVIIALSGMFRLMSTDASKAMTTASIFFRIADVMRITALTRPAPLTGVRVLDEHLARADWAAGQSNAG